MCALRLWGEGYERNRSLVDEGINYGYGRVGLMLVAGMRYVVGVGCSGLA